MPFDDGAATPEEIREFCNRVRVAGGADVLDALLPSIPDDPESCLIARNLNFHCEVNGDNNNYASASGTKWHMTIMENRPLAERIANELDLPVEHYSGDSDISLPRSIGLAAEKFDARDERYDEFVQTIATVGWAKEGK